MLTYENIEKTLNEQEDEILVKIHNKYCEEKDKMHLKMLKCFFRSNDTNAY